MPETEQEILEKFSEESLPRPRGEAPDEKPDFSMINMEEMLATAGGAFRATSMMQKRLREIVRFAPDQIAGKVDNKQLIYRVMNEIADKTLQFTLAEDIDGEEE
ncbi:MAG: hypothetical protein AB7K09_06460 [Planctomycetota bacterium]